MRHGGVKQITSVGGAPIRILVVGGGCAGMSAACASSASQSPTPAGKDAEITVVAPAAVHDLPARSSPRRRPARSPPRHVVVPLRRVLHECRVLIGEVDHDRPRHAQRRGPRPRHGERRPERDPLRRSRPRPRLGLPHRSRPGPRRARHRLQDRRGGHRPAQPRPRADRHRLLHPRPRVRDAALTFVFVGGGYAGVEALGELEDMARYAARYYHNVGPRT